MSIKFASEYDPITKKDKSLIWNHSVFQELISDTDSLFKLAAKSLIEYESLDEAKVALSLKYEVLCPLTSFLGITR
jgi:hypothetical protein